MKQQLKDKIKSYLPYSISFRMISSISVIVLIVMLCSSAFTYLYFGKVLKEEHLKKDYQVLKEDAQYLEMLFQEITLVAQNMLFDEQIQDFCRNEGNDYYAIENIAGVMARHISVRHSIHSVLLKSDYDSVWSAFPFDSSAQAALEEDFYGYSKPFVIQYGNVEQELVGYRSLIHDLKNPQRVIGELTILLDLNQLRNLTSSWNQQENELSLIENNAVLLESKSGINEEMLLKSDASLLFERGIESLDMGTLLAIPIQSTPYHLITYRSNQALQRKAWPLIPFFILSSVLLLFILFLLLYKRIQALTQPIRCLQKGMVAFAQGDMGVQVTIQSHDELEVLGNNFNEMVKDIDSLMQKSIEDEKMKKKIKFDMMISKIHPHFIYNTLNSIIVMARKEGNQDVIEMVRSLILILQDSMSVHDELLYDTVQKEISIIEAYVKIQNYRYKNKINLRFEIQEDLLNQKIAKNILQPIVENAIFHGIVPKAGIGTIVVSIEKKKEKIWIQIADDGVGMEEELVESMMKGSASLKDQRKNKDSVHSIALINVLERLEFLYGSSLDFQVKSKAGQGTLFSICFKEEVHQ